MPLLPVVRNWDQYKRVFPRRRMWTRAMRAILARHGFSWGKVTSIFPGTCIVFMVRTKERRDVVVKLFGPFFARAADAELASLSFLAVRTRLNIPRVLASGILRDRQSWRYLILRPIDGVPLRETLRKMPRRQGEAVAAALGRFVHVMHRVGRNKFRLAGPEGAAWGKQARRMIRQAMANCRKFPIYRRLLRQGLVTKLRRHVRSAPGLVPVLVNNDLTEDHVMVVHKRGRWRFNGVIDFGDVRRAHAGCELFPLWFGALARKPNLLKKYLRAYSPGLRVTKAWLDSMTAFCLIHEFGPMHMAGLLKRVNVAPASLSWDRLRSWIWRGVPSV